MAIELHKEKWSDSIGVVTIGIGEKNASGRQTVQIGCLCARVAAQTPGPIVEVIDSDEEHIRLFTFCCQGQAIFGEQK